MNIDLMDWMILWMYLAGIVTYMVVDKIYRSMDDGWLEDHLQKRRENE